MVSMLVELRADVTKNTTLGYQCLGRRRRFVYGSVK